MIECGEIKGADEWTVTVDGQMHELLDEIGFIIHTVFSEAKEDGDPVAAYAFLRLIRAYCDRLGNDDANGLEAPTDD